MGKTQTGKSKQVPGYAGEVQPALGTASNLLTGEGGKESPFYSDLARMFSNTLGSMKTFQLPDWLTQTIQESATTGMPSLTPLQETPYYKAVEPTFSSALEQNLAKTKEQFGAQGALRTGAYETAGQKGVTEALGGLITQAAQTAYGLEEAAKGRRLTGAQLGMGAQAAPFQTASAAGGAASGISSGEYPLLSALLSFISSGAGQVGQGYQWTPNFSCCFHFMEGEGFVPDAVSEYRDEHYGHESFVANGYRMMARKLVPLMRRFKLVKRAVVWLMLKPLTQVAENYYELNNSGFVFKPLAYFWTSLWSGSARLKLILR